MLSECCCCCGGGGLQYLGCHGVCARRVPAGALGCCLGRPASATAIAVAKEPCLRKQQALHHVQVLLSARRSKISRCINAAGRYISHGTMHKLHTSLRCRKFVILDHLKWICRCIVTAVLYMPSSLYALSSFRPGAVVDFSVNVGCSMLGNVAASDNCEYHRIQSLCECLFGEDAVNSWLVKCSEEPRCRRCPKSGGIGSQSAWQQAWKILAPATLDLPEPTTAHLGSS